MIVNIFYTFALTHCQIKSQSINYVNLSSIYIKTSKESDIMT